MVEISKSFFFIYAFAKLKMLFLIKFGKITFANSLIDTSGNRFVDRFLKINRN